MIQKIRISKAALEQMLKELNNSAMGYVAIETKQVNTSEPYVAHSIRMVENKSSLYGHYMSSMFSVTGESNNGGDFNVIDKS